MQIEISTNFAFMNSVKEELHTIIEDFDDEDFLESVYEILKEKKNQHPGILWGSLTSSQQKEVLQTATEINEPLKQTSHTEMVIKNRKWLGK
jgi:hypothetical protein